MKGIFFLPFFALLAMAFQSSVKPDPKPKIKKTINLKTGSSAEYVYNTDGSIASITNSKGTRTTYKYVGNMVVKELHTPVVTGSSNIDTFLLNKSGLEESVINYQNGLRFDTKREYDEQRHLIRIFVAGDGLNQMHDLNSFFFNGGNEVKNIFWDDHKKPLQTDTYTYYTDKRNTIGNDNMGMSFLGAQSKNAIKEDKGITYDRDTFIVTYNYQFDERDRISLKVSRNKKGVLMDSTAYTYY